jgi:hypothetical protein
MVFVRVHCPDDGFYQWALSGWWFLPVSTVQVMVSISEHSPVDGFCPCPLSMVMFSSHRCALFNWFLLSVHVIKVLVSVSVHCLGHGFWQCPLSRWWFLSGSSPSYNFYQSALSKWWFLPVSIVQVMDSVLKRHSRESFWQYALSRWWFLSVYTAHWWWFLSVASVQEDGALLFALSQAISEWFQPAQDSVRSVPRQQWRIFGTTLEKKNSVNFFMLYIF